MAVLDVHDFLNNRKIGVHGFLIIRERGQAVDRVAEVAV